jgi:protein arginine kinase activator
MPILCQKCSKNNATVHLTDIISGEKREYHLCSDCAEKEGVINKPTAINQLLHEFVMQKQIYKELAALSCDHCGMNFAEFRSNGQLGCPNDYDAFRKALEPLIERSQEGFTQHCGKMPRRISPPVRAKIDLIRLRRELKTAVDAEQYENAAKLRDEIERLEAL